MIMYYQKSIKHTHGIVNIRKSISFLLLVFEEMTLFMESCDYFKKFKKTTKPEVKESRTNFNNESTM